MTRAKYEPGELDSNHQIVEGIRKVLDTSHSNRARTTLCAIANIDLSEAENGGSLENKIQYVCETLKCMHERVGKEIVFIRR